jgi:hypothetical protein
MKKWTFVALLLVGATILGGTVFREPIASAAQSVDANIIGPLDGQGNVKVHEQGTARVSGTVGLSGSGNTVKLDPNANTVKTTDPTKLLFSAALHNGSGGVFSDPFDVSSAKKVRVYAKLSPCSSSQSVEVTVFPPDAPHTFGIMVLETFTVPCPDAVTKTYDVPGDELEFLVQSGPGETGTDTELSVYG